MAENSSYPAGDYVVLGKITKAHGLRGEVKILSYSGQPENFKGYKEIFTEDSSGKLSTPLTVKNCRTQGKIAIVKLGSIDNRNLAEELEGREVLLAKETLPPPAEDEFYWYQYQGKKVKSQNGQDIGIVESLFSNGAQDILVIRSGNEEILIPITKEIIIEETEEGLIINPPPGLLELNSDTGN